jgi:hemolysin-activating ACP:hemolysin acyltransferase
MVTGARAFFLGYKGTGGRIWIMQYLVPFGAEEAAVQTAGIFLATENQNTRISGFM